MRPSRLLPLLVCLMLMAFSFGARALPGEPTVPQIYQTAESGDLAKARQMIDQVISIHPNSARAHYVKAEIAARGGDAATAKAELQKAEQLAPALDFVKPAAATALRQQIDALPADSAATRQSDTRRMGAPPARAGGGLGLRGLLVPALLVAGLVFLLRRRSARHADTAGPDDFGRYPVHPYPPQGPSPGAGPAPYGYPPSEGMGSSMTRAIGTGLAIGAGAAAAQGIGRRVFDLDANATQPHQAGHAGSNANSPLARDAGLGDGGGFDVGTDEWD